MPEISVILPVYNGGCTLDRAISSVLSQTMPDWELIAVDDCSTDGSFEYLSICSQRDPRIRTLKTRVNSGPSAARNVGLQVASGSMIAYLDSDDEYYEDYLLNITTHMKKNDILVFNYDVFHDGSDGIDFIETWDPSVFRGEFFSQNIAVPLGVSHQRKILSLVEGFDESLWCLEDWDLWKRFARCGLEFVFLPLKSGKYYVRADSRSRLPRATARQERAFRSTRYQVRNSNKSTILFASFNSLIDLSNGASIAMADTLKLLARQGFSCHAFCASKTLFPSETYFEDRLRDLNVPHELRDLKCGTHFGRLLFTRWDSVPLTMFCTRSTQHWNYDIDELIAFLCFYEKTLDELRPDVLLSAGPVPFEDLIFELARRRDIPVVLGVHNFKYNHVRQFKNVDMCYAPSKFAADYYWETLRLDCRILPNPIDPERILASHRDPRFVTFINPTLEKGALAFARVAEVLEHRRPDIPLLVVEGRGTRTSLEFHGVDIRSYSNVHIMSHTSDPKLFWNLTRICVMPSLWWENQPLVAIEAMANGIPVLGSNRGGIPEVLG